MKPLEKKLEQAWPAECRNDVTVLIGVSGGADSVALLRALAASADSPDRLVVAHFNHRLRGEASDADQRFVEHLAEALGVTVHCGASEIVSSAMSEGDSRALRYRFFESLAAQRGARYLALAHTRDDQAETVLHRIVRGTGLRGLSGIPFVRPLSELTTIVRPLLAVSRDEVLDYLRELDQRFQQDASNLDRGFTRNRIRHELLPELEAHYHLKARDALVRLAEQAAENQNILDQIVQPLIDACVSRIDQRIIIDTGALAAVEPYLVRHLLIEVWSRECWPLQAMSHERWHDLAAMIASPPSRARIDLPAVSAQWDRDRLVLILRQH